MKQQILDALYAIRQASGPKQEIIDSFVEGAVQLTSSKIGYFSVVNQSEDILTMVGWSRTVMDTCTVMDRPIVYPLEETGLWGDCVRERAPVVTNDYKALIKNTKKGYPEGHVHLVRHANIPIWEGKHIAGVLGVGNKESDYTTEDIDNLIDFAQECWRTMKEQLS